VTYPTTETGRCHITCIMYHNYRQNYRHNYTQLYTIYCIYTLTTPIYSVHIHIFYYGNSFQRSNTAGRCHVIELHKMLLFIYIPYAKEQIWTFNLFYIYADWSFCYLTYNVFSFYGLSYSDTSQEKGLPTTTPSHSQWNSTIQEILCL
jgi:hypothetical protein